MMLTVRFFAAARAATGAASTTLTLPEPAPLGEILNQLRLAFPASPQGEPELASVLPRCSFLRNGVIMHEQVDRVEPGDTLDVLPPFSGG